MNTTTGDQSARLVISGNDTWFGDPRLGTFTIYLDGSLVGKVAPADRLRVPCQSGPHTVRARQWWYLSRPTQIDVRAGEELRMMVGFNQDAGTLTRILTGMFAPWRALRVTSKTVT